MRLLAAAILLAAVHGAAAQTRRNGDEYGFRNHQPTQAEVAKRERRAGVAPSSPQARRNAQDVQSLDRKLLREEAAPLPRDPGSVAPP